jgi:hypothetical protein
MTEPLFEIPGRAIDPATWREGWRAPEASSVTLRGAGSLVVTRENPACTGDPSSPHYLDRARPLVDTLPEIEDEAELRSLCEAYYTAFCLAWKELSFEAEGQFGGTGPVQVFGYVGRAVEYRPLEAGWAFYRVRVEA